MMSLVFDADDTLWENNVLFERAIEQFIDGIAEEIHRTFAADGQDGRTGVRALFNEIEKRNTMLHGYGCAVFERSLQECLAKLTGTVSVAEAEAVLIRELCRPIREGHIELLPDVKETLGDLASRHRLFMLTKGDRAEQQRKIDASGLSPFFAETVIVPEKNEQAYHDFVATRGLDRTNTWMIGNSPRSDVLPALAADLGAVLIPHPMTWILEHDEVPEPHDRFSIVERITHVRGLF